MLLRIKKKLKKSKSQFKNLSKFKDTIVSPLSMPKIEKDNNPLVLTTNMKPIADQVSAINQLVSNIKQGIKSQKKRRLLL